MMRSLCSRTQELVRNRPVTVTYWKISENTGVTVEWLRSFVNNRAVAPDANKVQAVYEYLSGKKLELH